MDTDLTAISTFGWYTGVAVQNNIKAISTFGWWFDAVISTADNAEIILFSLCLSRLIEMGLER